MRNLRNGFVVGLVVALVAFSFVCVSLAQEKAKVNINTATAEQLTQLKGVGSAYAERIVEYREKNGPFEKPEDLMKVQGIGQKTWEDNKDIIVVK
jgi:competence protein ComEA